MKVFLGSSGECLPILRRIAKWVTEAGHEALPWNKPGLFPVGHYTFDTLNVLKDKVDASIFIFGEDDKVWYRKDTVHVPRDNVLIEYGLFAGVLEPSRVAIIKNGTVRVASDLHGVTYIGFNDTRRAKLELDHWFARLATSSPSPGRTRLMAFQNKFSVPETHLYWRGLAEQAKNRFILVGGSNKSWIHHSTERRESLGRSIARIIGNCGEVALLCYDRSLVLRRHQEFIRECVVAVGKGMAKSERQTFFSSIQRNLRVAASNSLRYQALISDAKIVVMPLLQSPEFKEESLVFELSPAKQREHHTAYQNDILRTIAECEIPGFVKMRCTP